MVDNISTLDLAKLAEEDPRGPLAAFLRGGLAPEAKPEEKYSDFLKTLTGDASNDVSEKITPEVLIPPSFVPVLDERTGLSIKVKYHENFRGNKAEAGESLDLYVSHDKPVTLNSAEGRVKTIMCGFSVALPVGFEGQIRPLSEMSSKGLHCHFGVVPSDYRGEIYVVLTNHSTRAFALEPGTRIAQMVVVPVQKILPVEEEF